MTGDGAIAAAIVAGLDDITLAQLADRLKPFLLAPLTPAERPGGYVAPAAAADYLGVSRKRIYDLTSMGSLVPDGRDGRTPLFTRETLDSYARGRS